MLVTAEVALAKVLLTAAGLLVQAFRKVERADPGFRADCILTYQIALPSSPSLKYEKSGVRFAAVTSATPPGGHSGDFF